VTVGRRITPGVLAWVIPVVVYLVLSLSGATTSSLGVHALRESQAHPHGTTIGTPEPIRSDEYMTETSIGLGKIAAGPDGTSNPLSVPANYFQQFPSGPVSAVVFLDGSVAQLLGPVLPDEMLFAAKWWLPTLLLVLGLPAWFRFVTGQRRWGYVACALVFFAPNNAWWSGRPVNTLGFMFAAGALMFWADTQAAEKRRLRAAAAMLVSAILMARYPSYYQPYAIVLGLPVLAATCVFLLVRSRFARTTWVVVGVTGVLAAVLTGATMLESISAIRAGLDTVYPGHRRSTGERGAWYTLFGATALGDLRNTQSGLVGTNASEVSTSFSALIGATCIFLIAGWRRMTGASRAAIAVFLAFALVWLAWCGLDLPASSAAIPVLNLVPAVRAAQVVGFIVVIAFCLVIAHLRSRVALPAVVAAGAVSAGLVTLGSVSYAHAVPATPSWVIWAGGTGLVLAVVLAGLVPARWPAAVVAVATALFLTVQVNPLQVGLGDLRGTRAADLMLAAADRARADHSVWASDSIYVDALMFAEGTPALSSRQQIGPDRRAWELLDPHAAHEDAWNRGGTYIRFTWSDSPGDITWDNPTTDQVVMTASPCVVADRYPALRHVVSSRPLDLPCLEPDGRFRFAGSVQHIYRVTATR
jgi:hypothetical protein